MTGSGVTGSGVSTRECDAILHDVEGIVLGVVRVDLHGPVEKHFDVDLLPLSHQRPKRVQAAGRLVDNRVTVAVHYVSGTHLSAREQGGASVGCECVPNEARGKIWLDMLHATCTLSIL